MSRFSAASREAAGQVVAYPTRNFATLGTLLRPRFRTARSFRFRLALHVAVKVGPSLRSYGALSVWPLRILSWTLIHRTAALPAIAVHRICDFHDGR